MLQIISGKFYTEDERRTNLLRGTLYSNMSPPWRCDPIETAAGTLVPSTAFRGLRTLSYEVLETYEGAPGVGIIVSLGVDPFIKDFAAITSFALNVICTPDPDLLRRLVGDQPLSPSTISAPRKYVGRVFETEVNVNEAELDEFKTFVGELMGLKRIHYQAAIGAIQTYVTGLHRIGDDLDVAYTLLVASIESLAQTFTGPRPKWEDYDQRKRSAVDKALKGATDETRTRVRDALLEVEHVALARRFRSFALENVGASFFREEAAGQARAVGKADLIEAISHAYIIRSKYVHTLAAVPKQVSHVWDLGDTASHDGHPVLTLHGLARLARHLILAFVRESPKVEAEAYRYQSAFPNTVTVEMAPQYWVWKHEGFEPSGARQKLGGFLDLVVALQTEQPQPALTDVRDLLRKYEQLIPQAKAADRLPMMALYVLFNVLVRKEDRVPDAQLLMKRYESLLQPPSLEGLGVRFALSREVEWSAPQLAKLYAGYYVQKYKKAGLKLPGLYETALALSLVEAYRKEGDAAAADRVLTGALDNQPRNAALQNAQAALAANVDDVISWRTLLLRPPEAASSATDGTL